MKNKWIYLFISLIFLTFLLSISLGVSSLGIEDILNYLFNRNRLDHQSIYIIENLRLPRTLAAFLVGFSLGLSGLLLQTLLQNPMVEPYTLGLSGGASLGSLLFLIVGVHPSWAAMPLGALTGSLFVTFFIIKLASKTFYWSQNRLILVGIMISLFCGSLVTIGFTLLDPLKMQTNFFWLIGQVGTDRDQWWPFLFILILLSILFIYFSSHRLDSLLLGEDIATSLGAHPKHLRKWVLIIISLLTSFSVSIAGIVGFVGLLAPQLTFQLSKSLKHRQLIFISGIIGGLLLLGSDMVARLISQEKELPAGAIAALIGAPFLIYILLRQEFRVQN